MASQVQIGKLALQHIGDRYDISSLDEATVEAEQVNLLFNDTRDWLLRQHPWNFAKKYASPAELTGSGTTAVPGNWERMYLYPVDCVKMGGIVNPLGDDQPAIKFEVARNSDSKRVVLCNVEEAEIWYTARIEDPTDFDPEFTMAFSYALAAKMAMPLTGERSIANDLMVEARNHISSAWETDANEGVEESAPDADWIRARTGVVTNVNTFTASS